MNNEDRGESKLYIDGVTVRYEQDPLVSPEEIQSKLEKRLANLRQEKEGPDRHRRFLLLAFNIALEIEQAFANDPGWFGEPVKVLLGEQVFTIEAAASTDEIRAAVKRVNVMVDHVKKQARVNENTGIALLAAAGIYGDLFRLWHRETCEKVTSTDSTVVEVEGKIVALKYDGGTISGRIRGEGGGELPFFIALDRHALLEGRMNECGIIHTRRLIVRE